MDFNFKKARNMKRREDKARSAHHGHPGYKNSNPNLKPKQDDSNQKSSGPAHLENIEKPALLTERDVVISQQETENETSRTDTKSYSRRSVVSNWERYELPTDTPEERPEGALDFETLINSLPDVEGHLKLSHEQSWGDERSELQEIFFNIDMHQLFTSLERVPFHVRQNVPASMFTSEQLTVFEQDANDALQLSCALKVTPKEDSVRQKISVIPASEVDYDNKSTKSPCILSKSAETSDTTKNDIIEKPTPIGISEAKPSQSQKVGQITPETEKLSHSGVPAACSRNDELDLDFLLSLDAALPDKPKHKEIGALGVSAITASKPTETEKLDDWLDNLLDD